MFIKKLVVSDTLGDELHGNRNISLLIPFPMVPSRPSFVDFCFGTRCDGAYSTIVLYWVPEMMNRLNTNS